MQPVISDFIAWFGRFILVASVAMVAAHLAARWRQKRKIRKAAAKAVPGVMRSVRSGT